MSRKLFYLVVFVHLFLCCLAQRVIAQNTIPLKITRILSGKDSGTVRIIVSNQSTHTYYYTITLSGFINGAWKSVLSDINSLGVNEFTALKPVKPKFKVIKSVSSERIRFIYAYLTMSKIRFEAMYYKKKDFGTEGSITYTESI